MVSKLSQSSKNRIDKRGHGCCDNRGVRFETASDLHHTKGRMGPIGPMGRMGPGEWASLEAALIHALLI